MKFLRLLIICSVSFHIQLFSQNIKELKDIKTDPAFIQKVYETYKIRGDNPQKAIDVLKELLETSQNDYQRSIVYPELFELYATNNQDEKFYQLFENNLDNGISNSIIIMNDKIYPEYLEKYRGKERFENILKRNQEINEKMNKSSSAEYFVQKPANYRAEKKYPLLMAFHGGVGNLYDNVSFWNTELLKDSFIVAYCQGARYAGFYQRRFGEKAIENIKEVYTQVLKNYSVDTNRVVVGGPSAGGLISLNIAMNDHIPVAGVLPAFPVVPDAFDEITAKSLAERNVKIAGFSGEYDWGLKNQIKMLYLCNKAGVENRFIIFPEKGHEYPDDLKTEIDRSLKFIFKEM